MILIFIVDKGEEDVKKLGMFMIVFLTIQLGMFESVAVAEEANKKVVIDAGHGGNDPGASGNGLQEKALTLKIATLVDRYLQDHYRVETKMTRTGDTTVSLQERSSMANSWGADFYLSAHINSGGGTGYEDYTYSTSRMQLSVNEESKRIQRVIHEEVKKVLVAYNVRDRGSKEANFHVLRETMMPAVLTEFLFIDHAEDAKLLQNDNFIRDISNALGEGVAKALELPARASSPGVTGELYETTANLNVRASAGVTGQFVTVALKGTKVTITETTKVGNVSWGYGVVNEKSGWMSMDYLKALKSEEKPIPSHSSSKVLKRGDVGPAVGDLQRTLIRLGYNLSVDNSFGPATDRALRDFQSKNGLAADGRPGPATQAKFQQLLNGIGEVKPPSGNGSVEKPVFSPSRVLKYGNVGADVGSLQSMLNYFGYQIAVDNSFGPATDKALRDFQRKNGLVADGRPGPATQAKFKALK